MSNWTCEYDRTHSFRTYEYINVFETSILIVKNKSIETNLDLLRTRKRRIVSNKKREKKKNMPEHWAYHIFKGIAKKKKNSNQFLCEIE